MVEVSSYEVVVEVVEVTLLSVAAILVRMTLMVVVSVVVVRVVEEKVREVVRVLVVDPTVTLSKTGTVKLRVSVVVSMYVVVTEVDVLKLVSMKEMEGVDTIKMLEVGTMGPKSVVTNVPIGLHSTARSMSQLFKFRSKRTTCSAPDSWNI